MIQFNKYILPNGLKLIHHYDSATKMVALNLLYNVGSKDESPDCTGLAHLVEHLMFTGSDNVGHFDKTLQRAGGSSNAWTNADMTNYYETLPAHNIETALWIERDRLTNLTLSDESIDVQKQVVMEEFKQRSINVPYGDLGHIIHSAAYTVHPYMWPTIGKHLQHIENVSNDEIKSFHARHYKVNNLIMCISGNVTFERAIELVEKWFGDIPAPIPFTRSIPQEPVQNAKKIVEHSGDVPYDMLLRCYHMPGIMHHRFPQCDLLSDVFANGKSSRFQQNVLDKSTKFIEFDATVEGTIDPGLFVVRACLNDGTTFEEAESIIDSELGKVLNDGVGQYELDKCINKFHASTLFDNIGYQEKATRLCKYELCGDAQRANDEVDRYRSTTIEQMNHNAAQLLQDNNCTTIYYKKGRKADKNK